MSSFNFSLRNLPVVIEPGVNVLEADISIVDKKAGDRAVAVRLFRVPLDEQSIQLLPLIPTTRHQHVFSLTHDLKKSAALVVYDQLGRLALVYTKDEKNKSWQSYDVADEHAGKSVTQFSVRFSFNTSKERDKFVKLMGNLASKAMAETEPEMEEVMSALRILGRSRVNPVVLPVAIDKANLSRAKL